MRRRGCRRPPRAHTSALCALAFSLVHLRGAQRALTLTPNRGPCLGWARRTEGASRPRIQYNTDCKHFYSFSSSVSSTRDAQRGPRPSGRETVQAGPRAPCTSPPCGQSFEHARGTVRAGPAPGPRAPLLFTLERSLIVPRHRSQAALLFTLERSLMVPRHRSQAALLFTLERSLMVPRHGSQAA